jgi:hypothetical protein
MLTVPRIVITTNLVATLLLSAVFTQFTAPDVILSFNSWGAGTPTNSGVAAFATFGPWWRVHEPEPFVSTPWGGTQPLVEVPRSDLRVTRRLALPLRGVGYEAFLGAVTFVRSLFSDRLVFDYVLMLRVQQGLLLVALGLLPLALYLALPDRRSPHLFTAYNVAYLAVLLAWPNKSKFLTEGIIDSAIANALALLAVAALVVVARAAASRSRAALLALLAASLFLGFCPLVRGELLPAIALAYLFLIAVVAVRDRRAAGLVAASLAVAVAPTIGHAAVNEAVFGHFAPRVQAGQNLFEPIGQFPNPYGIEYSDVWFEAHVRELGYEYPSFEADAYASSRYVEILRERPGLLWSNFMGRLREMRGYYKVPIHVLTLVAGLVLAVWLSIRRPRLVPVFLPLVLMIGFAAFLGWTHDLMRATTPIHFLWNAFLCFALADLLAAIVLRHLSATAPGSDGVSGLTRSGDDPVEGVGVVEHHRVAGAGDHRGRHAVVA